MKISTIISKALSVIYMGVLGSAVYLGTPQLLTATLFLSWIWILSVGISFGVIYLAFKLGKPEDIVKIIEEFKTPSTLLKIFSIFLQAVVLVGLIYLGLVATAVVIFFVYIATWCLVYAFKVAQKQLAELKEQDILESAHKIAAKDLDNTLVSAKGLSDYIAKLNKDLPQ